MKRNFFAGEWQPASSATRNINPSNIHDVVGEYAQGDDLDTQQAIEAARAALPAMAALSPNTRAECLIKVANELAQRADELGFLLAREEGKTLAEARGEVLRASQIFRFYSGEAVRLKGEFGPSTRVGLTVEISREPIGVVGIITPWNFPIAIPAWKIAPALAYGNCVVFKPAELVPGSAWALAEIISRCGLPVGAFNMVMGRGSIVGQTLVNSPHVTALTFTGSSDVGRRILADTVGHFKKVQLEMGGKNPLVVLADADLDVAVDCAVQGAFFSTGQRCTASSRLIVDQRIHAPFVERMTARLNNLRVGDACAPGTDIGPVVDERQLATDLSYISRGVSDGCRLASGGERLRRDTPGHYLSPALFVDVDPSHPLAREEIFGPVACTVVADGPEHALALANDSVYGLSAGVCTTSLKHATLFKRELQAGMVMVNTPTAGVDYHVPFGGRKASSHGSREQGQYAQEFFTTVKTAYTAA